MSEFQLNICAPPGVRKGNPVNPDVSQEEEEECYLFWAIICSLTDTSSFCGRVLGISLAWRPCIPGWSFFKFDALPCCMGMHSHSGCVLGAWGEGKHGISPCATLCPSHMWLCKKCSIFLRNNVQGI